MSVRERLLREALSRIEEARTATDRLAGASEDGAARAQLLAEFDSVEWACREFAEHQLGLNVRARGEGA